MFNAQEWLDAVKWELGRVTLEGLPGESEYFSLVTCDGHSLHRTSVEALRNRAMAWADRWYQSDQNNGERAALIQEMIVLFGLLVNAKRLDFWEATPLITMRKET